MGGKTGGDDKAFNDARKAGDLEAERARIAEEKRQARIRDGQNRIDKRLSEFDDKYFQGVEADYNDHYRPQVFRQYKTAADQIAYSMADAGNLQSSAAADLTGQLQTEFGQRMADIANQAVDAARQKRAALADTKADLYAQLNASADPEAALQMAAARRDILAQPTQYSMLGDLFGSLTNRVADTVGAYNRRQAYDRLNDILFNPGRGRGAQEAR